MILKGFNDDYTLENQVECGYQGCVYRARSTVDYLCKAVKIISKLSLREHKLMNKCLTNEISIMRHTTHKNLLKLHRIYEDEMNIYLVSNYYAAGDLEKATKGRKILDEHKIQEIMRNLLEAVADLHANDIIHRDIKPTNILMNKIDSYSDISLCDFGMSTYTWREEDTSEF